MTSFVNHPSLVRHASTSSSKDNRTRMVRSPTTITRWPEPFYESDGDYRGEAFLEKHVGGLLYENQSVLPKLPIPSIEQTLEQFLPTALVLAESQSERESLIEACRVFPKQVQRLQLQERLYARQQQDDQMKDSSWLQLWWNQMGYLQIRDPVVIYVSYFFLLDDDWTLPITSINSGICTSTTLASPARRARTACSTSSSKSPAATRSEYTKHEENHPHHLAISRGAAALCAAAEFRNQVVSGNLPQETTGRKSDIPLCSTAYKYLFHACRIPKPNQDGYKIYDPSLYKHAIVACRGRFFRIPLVVNNDNDDKPLSLQTFKRLLNQCVSRATLAASSLDNMSSSPQGLELGWLTTSNRDDWASTRSELQRLGGADMDQALTEMESGALLLCLDLENDVFSLEQKATHYWYGSPWNRWFDKSIQLVCTNNGKLGYIGEHSMMDGMPAINFCNSIVKSTHASCEDNCSTQAPQLEMLIEDAVQDIFEDVWTKLGSDEKDKIQVLITDAKDSFSRLVSDHEMHVDTFHGYGSNFMKKAGHSPDAYFQVALQLASYRLFGKQVGTYEASQVRPFLHGRTETTRSASPESGAFVREMGFRPTCDEGKSVVRNRKYKLLQEATQRHRETIANASKGMGVDRHFFGLSMLVQEGETTPSLFTDPLFIRSKRWRVSSSTTPHCPGFGEVDPDGVGFGYLVQPDACIYTVSCRKEQNYSEKLVHFLEEALAEMRTLIELESPLPDSKL